MLVVAIAIDRDARKQQLQLLLADQLGLEVTVCHYPSGASKWNPVEHKLFSYISINWAGKPLRSFETMLANTFKIRLQKPGYRWKPI